MNIPTRTSNVIKYLNYLISISFKVSNYIFQLLHFNIYEGIESSLLDENQIHSHIIIIIIIKTSSIGPSWKNKVAYKLLHNPIRTCATKN